MPVELNGNLLKELRGRTCRILADEVDTVQFGKCFRCKPGYGRQLFAYLTQKVY